jgi:serine protease Do
LQELTASGNQSSVAPEDDGEEEAGAVFGMNLAQLTPDIASRLGIGKNSKGLVVTNVDPTGVAARSGLESGDVITQVNMQDVRTVDEFRNAIQRLGNHRITLSIRRQGSLFFVPVK